VPNLTAVYAAYHKLELATKTFSYINCASYTIVMETVIPVGTTEMGTILTTYLISSLLCLHAFFVKHRMVINKLTDDFIWVDLLCLV
jgi:hypothetical protein